MPLKSRLRKLLDFASRSRDHELDELLSDFRLEAFGVALAGANHVGDDATVLAVRILHDFGGAGTRQMSPGGGSGVLARGVVNVAGFRVRDLRNANARAAAVLRGPRRCVGQRLI